MKSGASLILSLSVLFLFVPLAGAEEGATDTFTVGVGLPLSGPVSSMGQAVRNGITLFQERELQKEGVRFVMEDTKYDGKEAVTVARKLVALDKANFVMIWGNTPALAAAPVLESLQVRRIKQPSFCKSLKYRH